MSDTIENQDKVEFRWEKKIVKEFSNIMVMADHAIGVLFSHKNKWTAQVSHSEVCRLFIKIKIFCLTYLAKRQKGK